MATTIMISTSVKPDSRVTLALIFTVAFFQTVWTSSRRIMYKCTSSTYCPLQPHLIGEQHGCQMANLSMLEEAHKKKRGLGVSQAS
jgi:hypothetical protein